MDNNLITYVGIDDINYTIESEYDYIKKFKIEDYINTENEILEILSFSVSKEYISYNCINCFSEINLENLNIDENIVIINLKINLTFEYSSLGSSKIFFLETTLFKSIYIPLYDYLDEKLEIQIYTLDLYVNVLNNNCIYYVINAMLSLNCR